MQLFIFATLFGIVFCGPRIIPLKHFFAGDTTIVNGIETGAKLYLASNDDRSFLQNIGITLGNNKITADKLADYNDDGTLKYLTINDGLYITTTNNETVTSSLTGYFYATTYAQARDSTFAVYVITKSHSISRSEMKSTGVILNTKLVSHILDPDTPLKTSYVTSINQSPNTNIYFNWGIPDTDWLEVTNNTFFKNPLMVYNLKQDGNISDTQTRQFFDHIEPLQINLDYWYFLAMGPVNMQIENKYVSSHNYTNTATNTTGLVMNNFIYHTHIVSFQWDTTRASTVGTYINTLLDSHENVTFALRGDGIVAQTYGSTTLGVLGTTYYSAETLTVNASSIFPGTFFCQYYGYSGDLLPFTSTASTPSTTVRTTTSYISSTTVATTTKGSLSKSFIELICVAMFFALFNN